MKYCTRCGAPTRAKGPRCGSCKGEGLGEPDYHCPQCGDLLHRRDRLCQSCLDDHLDSLGPATDAMLTP